jgi:hypothetical protein
MEKGDNAAPPNRLTAANDNGTGTEPSRVDIDTALIRIAEAIGRHIARQHIHACRAANDNDSEEVE